MSEWFNGLTTWLASIWAAISGWWAWFMGGGLIRDVVAWMASVLPPASGFSQWTSYLTDWLAYIGPYLQLTSMVFPVWLAAALGAAALAIDIILLWPRIWAWVLKLAPFA